MGFYNNNNNNNVDGWEINQSVIDWDERKLVHDWVYSCLLVGLIQRVYWLRKTRINWINYFLLHFQQFEKDWTS